MSARAGTRGSVRLSHDAARAIPAGWASPLLLAIVPLLTLFLTTGLADTGGSQSPMDKAGIEQDLFGRMPDGAPVDRFTLRNGNGMMVRLITYGTIVTELHVPDRQGQMADVVLGFDNLAQYLDKHPYFGSLIGRVAFRIFEGKFELDGKSFQLALNPGSPHHLHGGPVGFSRVVWKASPLPGPEPAVKFTHTSPDGDQGYPGTLRLTVLYTITARNELRIEMTAGSDRATPVNMTHHGYFNLHGAGQGQVLDHVVQLHADRYSVMAAGGIPTGQLAAVEGTRFDFTRPTAVDARPDADGKPGYDLGYLHNRSGGWLATVASVYEPVSGRVLEVATTEPAVIFYTGNALDGTLHGKGGAVYGPQAGLCLEPGRLPNSVQQPAFPTTILRPGDEYRHTCVYRFSTR